MKWESSVSIWFWVMVWFYLLWGSSRICFHQPELRLSKRDDNLIPHVLAAWAQSKTCRTTRCVLSRAKWSLSWTMQPIEFNFFVFLSNWGRNNFPPIRSSTSSLHTDTNMNRATTQPTSATGDGQGLRAWPPTGWFHSWLFVLAIDPRSIGIRHKSRFQCQERWRSDLTTRVLTNNQPAL